LLKINRNAQALEPPPVWSEPLPNYGLSANQIFETEEVLPEIVSEAALALGDIKHVDFHIEHILEAFHILDGQF
jgi:hypothetical protein